MARASVAVLLLAFLVGCGGNTQPPSSASNLTPGMAKKTIVKGRTTQAEVVEVFGPPDLVTHRDNIEVWTYDKLRYDVENSGGYLTVGIAGAGGTRSSSSSTSTMLIVYFATDVVTDYRLSVVHF